MTTDKKELVKQIKKKQKEMLSLMRKLTCLDCKYYYKSYDEHICGLDGSYLTDYKYICYDIKLKEEK